MFGKRWKEIAETLKDTEEIYVYFFTKEEADERLQQDEDTDAVFTDDDWSRIVEKMDNNNYINHVMWETFHEVVGEAISERKGNGNNQ